MEPTDLVGRLELISRASGATELKQVTVYTGFRNDVEIAIEVHDAGPRERDYRYTVVATEDLHGRTASGEPGMKLEDVLREVHWDELDRPVE